MSLWIYCDEPRNKNITKKLSGVDVVVVVNKNRQIKFSLSTLSTILSYLERNTGGPRYNWEAENKILGLHKMKLKKGHHG